VTAAPATVLLTGMIAGTPHLGGLTWVALNQLFGLVAAGCDTHLVEPVTTAQLTPAGAPLASTDNAAYFVSVVDAFSIRDRATLLCTDTGETVGKPYHQLAALARRTDVVVNVGGVLEDRELLEPSPIRAYLDLDPGFTQLWAAQGADMRFEGHTHFVTVGPLLGTAGCPVPTLDRTWIGILPPVSLPHWPLAGDASGGPFTTVASWRGYGSVWHDGVHYGQKAHAMRPLFALPERTGEHLELALEIHPDERDDISALRRHRWKVVDPADVADSPGAFHRYVGASKAELGVAKLGYIAGRTGWFSDRSACYLAAGRPVVAHDTGFGSRLPTGEGLLAFAGLDGAEAGIAEVAGDYPRHRRAARRIAEDHLDAGKVMADLIIRLGAG
jgi:hypothetical protein